MDVVYFDSKLAQEPDQTVLGNKGLQLRRMYLTGVNVPYGCIFTSDFITSITNPNNKTETNKRLNSILRKISAKASYSPITFSLRSSPCFSMPGKLHTVINIGSHLLPDNTQSIRLKKGLSASLNEIGLTFKPGATIPNVIISCASRINQGWQDLRNELSDLPQDIFDHPVPLVFQAMVYSLSPEACSGVLFSHDVITGKPGLLMEAVYNSQVGIVDATRKPERFTESEIRDLPFYSQLETQLAKIRTFFHDPFDIEFVYDGAILWILQLRKLNLASIHSDKDKISSPKPEYAILEGDTVAPGRVSGTLIIDNSELDKYPNPILFTSVPSRTLLRDLNKLKGICTVTGGITSHLAISCRWQNTPYLTNCKIIDPQHLITGTPVILDTNSGKLYKAKKQITLATSNEKPSKNNLILSKSTGLEILKKAGLPVTNYFNSKPQKNIYQLYSVRTSLQDNSTGISKLNFGFPGKFGVAFKNLEQAITEVSKEFQELYHLAPDLIIHETHQIRYCGNIAVNKSENRITIEYWVDYAKTEVPVATHSATLTTHPELQASLDFSLPIRIDQIPFDHYILEFIVHKEDNSLLFTELTLLDSESQSRGNSLDIQTTSKSPHTII